MENKSRTNKFDFLVLGHGLLKPIVVEGDLGVNAGVVGPGTSVSPAHNSNQFLKRKRNENEIKVNR